MRKNIVLLALITISFQVGAAALRGVSIGDDCDSAFKLELSQGSSLKIDEKMKIFEGMHEGQRALIAYNCNDGKITLQSINISYMEGSEARNKVSELEKEFTRKYRLEPEREIDEESIWLVWKTEGVIITVSGIYGGDSSEVFISHGAP